MFTPTKPHNIKPSSSIGKTKSNIFRQTDRPSCESEADRPIVIFFLLGLLSVILSNLFDLSFSLLSENTLFEVLYNSDLMFGERQYAALDVDLCRIRLHEPLSVIVQQPLLYVRDMVPKGCLDALMKLNQVCMPSLFEERDFDMALI